MDWSVSDPSRGIGLIKKVAKDVVPEVVEFPAPLGE